MKSCELNLVDGCLLHLQQPDGFKTSYEEEYRHQTCSEWKNSNRMALLPLLASTPEGDKILMSETNLTDYPAMFLKTTDKAVLPPSSPVCLLSSEKTATAVSRF